MPSRPRGPGAIRCSEPSPGNHPHCRNDPAASRRLCDHGPGICLLVDEIASVKLDDAAADRAAHRVARNLPAADGRFQLSLAFCWHPRALEDLQRQDVITSLRISQDHCPGWFVHRVPLESRDYTIRRRRFTQTACAMARGARNWRSDMVRPSNSAKWRAVTGSCTAAM